MAVLPYNKVQSKKEQVTEMFDNISHKYDFLNHFLSFGIDFYWRSKAIRILKKSQPKIILDVATGTADFAIEALKCDPDKIIGVDISPGMLELGKKKLKERNLEEKIELQIADSESLPFSDNNFDAVIVSFGVRNFENLEQGLSEIRRVTKTGGKALVMEFSSPTLFPFKQLFQFYFTNILPLMGRLFSNDDFAYKYLPDSVKAFPSGSEFCSIMEKVGFKSCRCIPLTLGVCSIYLAEK